MSAIPIFLVVLLLILGVSVSFALVWMVRKKANPNDPTGQMQRIDKFKDAAQHNRAYYTNNDASKFL